MRLCFLLFKFTDSFALWGLNLQMPWLYFCASSKSLDIWLICQKIRRFQHRICHGKFIFLFMNWGFLCRFFFETFSNICIYISQRFIWYEWTTLNISLANFCLNIVFHWCLVNCKFTKIIIIKMFREVTNRRCYICLSALC